MDPYLAAIIALLVIEIVFVSIRIYIRAFMVRSLGWDDLSCVVTLALAMGFSITQISLYVISDLKPIAELPISKLRATINLLLASESFYIIGTSSLKLSLGMLLLRVMISTKVRIAAYVLMAVSICYGLACFFVVLFECGDPAHYWLRFASSQCLPITAIKGLGYGHAVLIATADLGFAGLASIFLYHARIHRRDKISVGAILTFACLGCVSTFVRIIYIPELAKPTTNYIRTGQRVDLLSAIELSVGLVCVSLATYRPLIHFLLYEDEKTLYVVDENIYIDAPSSNGSPRLELESQERWESRGSKPKEEVIGTGFQ